jgi:predicted nucleotidyltransferase
MNTGLSEKNTALITDTLRQNGVIRAKLFGSRAKGNFRYNSDIDIALWGNANIGRLYTVLDELPMPYKFDIINYETITHKPLKDHIDRVGVELMNNDG